MPAPRKQGRNHLPNTPSWYTYRFIKCELCSQGGGKDNYIKMMNGFIFWNIIVQTLKSTKWCSTFHCILVNGRIQARLHDGTETWYFNRPFHSRLRIFHAGKTYLTSTDTPSNSGAQTFILLNTQHRLSYSSTVWTWSHSQCGEKLMYYECDQYLQ